MEFRSVELSPTECVWRKSVETEIVTPVAVPLSRYNGTAAPLDRFDGVYSALKIALRCLEYFSICEFRRTIGRWPDLQASASGPESLVQSAAALAAITNLARQANIEVLPDHTSPVVDLELFGMLDRLQEVRAASSGVLEQQIRHHAQEIDRGLYEFLRSAACLTSCEIVGIRSTTALAGRTCEIVRFKGPRPEGAATVLWNPPDSEQFPVNRPLLIGGEGRPALELWPLFQCQLDRSRGDAPSLQMASSPSQIDALSGHVGPDDVAAAGSVRRLASRPHDAGGDKQTAVLSGETTKSLRRSLQQSRAKWSGKKITGQFGSYEIATRLASGEAASVYLATDAKGRPVCIKMIPVGKEYNEKVIVRFERQVYVFQQLGNHPGIIPVIDYGCGESPDGGVECFLVMEWAEGGDLDQWIRRRGCLAAPATPTHRSDLVERLQLFAQIVETVAHLHSHRVIHRDIKPSNVLMRRDGTPLLADLDLVRNLANQDPSARVTTTGAFVGTPMYMAPEQRAGHSDVGASVDVYALGLLLYELLLGERAAPELSLHREGLFSRFRAVVGPALANLLEKCLRSEPHGRFPTANELLSELRVASVVPGAGPAAGSGLTQGSGQSQGIHVPSGASARSLLEPYEGADRFIFVSYAHVDSSDVYVELEELSRQGFRIWYDRGILAGTVWPDEVAVRLERCDVVLVFLSEFSVRSEHVKDEIYYALNNQKHIVPVYLEETELPQGLKLRLARVHAIFRTRVQTEDYRHMLALALDQYPVREPPTAGTRPTVVAEPAPAVPLRKTGHEILVAWEDLPDRDRKEVTVLLDLLKAGRFVRLQNRARVLSRRNDGRLVELTRRFCEEVVELRLHILTHNPSQTVRALDRAFHVLTDARDVYARYVEILRPAIVEFAKVLQSSSPSQGVVEDIRSSLRRLALDLEDDALFRELDQ